MNKLSALFPAFLIAACALPRGEDLGTDRAAIQGGSTNASDKFAVAVLDENGEVCSGTLIAPNLVLTARHCIAAGGGNNFIDCDNDTFDPPWAPDTYRVTSAQDADYGAAPYHAKKILVPSTTKFCGGDIALVILEENVPAAAATPAVPQLKAPTATKITAIGYGATSPLASDEGTRHRRDNISVLCIPGHATLDCDPVNDHDMTATEIATGDGLCGGDSGGGAYVLAGTPTVIGVLSRALDSGPTCSDAVFTRTDSYANFIIAGAKEAAIAGNYTPPAWAGPVTEPTPDGGKTGEPTTKPPGEDDPTTDPGASSGAKTVTTSGCSSSPAAGAPPWALALGLLALLRRKRGSTTRA